MRFSTPAGPDPRQRKAAVVREIALGVDQRIAEAERDGMSEVYLACAREQRADAARYVADPRRRQEGAGRGLVDPELALKLLAAAHAWLDAAQDHGTLGVCLAQRRRAVLSDPRWLRAVAPAGLPRGDLEPVEED